MANSQNSKTPDINQLWLRKAELEKQISALRQEMRAIDDELFAYDCEKEGEIWKTHPDWATYQVSSLGRVRSLTRKTKSRYGENNYKGGLVEPIVCSNRYLAVNFTDVGKRKQFFVHRLVLETFVGPCPSKGHQACHGNGIRCDNRLENLRWDTIKANNKDKFKHGTILRGEQNGQSKITEEKAKYIKYSEIGLTKLSKIMDIPLSTLEKIRYGNNWKHI